MSTYKLLKSLNGDIKNVIKDEYLSIPFVEGNTDYEEYLKWLAEGNEPLPADE